MKYYAVAEITVTDPAWVDEYLAKVTPMVHKVGARYLARTDKAERLEGDQPVPSVFVIIEWPSKEVATKFYESDEYAPFLANRKAGSNGPFALVPGEDIAA